jgi:hypothetical protein
MALEEGRERFTNAIGILVDEKERIKDRLLVAYASQLSRIVPNDYLPAGMIDDFDKLKYALSDAEIPYGYGEYASKKIHDMSENEASEIARAAYAMFLELRDLKTAEARR